MAPRDATFTLDGTLNVMGDEKTIYSLKSGNRFLGGFHNLNHIEDAGEMNFEESSEYCWRVTHLLKIINICVISSTLKRCKRFCEEISFPHLGPTSGNYSAFHGSRESIKRFDIKMQRLVGGSSCKSKRKFPLFYSIYFIKSQVSGAWLTDEKDQLRTRVTACLSFVTHLSKSLLATTHLTHFWYRIFRTFQR